jgi:hypothetical protein
MPALYGQGLYGRDSYGQLGLLTVIAIGDDLEYVTPPANAPDVPQDIALTQAGDFVVTPTGDLATVHGPARLLQDIWMLAVTVQGTLLGDPSYGNLFAGQIGQPALTQAIAQSRAAGLAKQIGQLQDLRAAAGFQPGAGERVASVTVDTVNVNGVAASVSMTVHTTTGAAGNTTVPVAGAAQLG